MAKRKATIKPKIDPGKLISARKFNQIIKLFNEYKNLSKALDIVGKSRSLFELVILNNNTYRTAYEDAIRTQMSMITESFVARAEEGDAKSAQTALKILNDEINRLSDVDDGQIVVEFHFPPPTGIVEAMQ